MITRVTFDTPERPVVGTSWYHYGYAFCKTGPMPCEINERVDDCLALRVTT